MSKTQAYRAAVVMVVLLGGARTRADIVLMVFEDSKPAITYSTGTTTININNPGPIPAIPDFQINQILAISNSADAGPLRLKPTRNVRIVATTRAWAFCRVVVENSAIRSPIVK